MQRLFLAITLSGAESLFLALAFGIVSACASNSPVAEAPASNSDTDASSQPTYEVTTRRQKQYFRGQTTAARKDIWPIVVTRRGMLELEICESTLPTSLHVKAVLAEGEQSQHFEGRSGKCQRERWAGRVGERWLIEVSGPPESRYLGTLQFDGRAPDHPDLSEAERLSFGLDGFIAGSIGTTAHFSPESCRLRLEKDGQHDVEFQIPLDEVFVRTRSAKRTATNNAAIEFVCTEDGSESNPERHCIRKASTSWSGGTPHHVSRDRVTIERWVVPVRPADINEIQASLRRLNELCAHAHLVGGTCPVQSVR